MRHSLLQRAGLRKLIIGQKSWYRTFYSATARITTIDPKGSPVSYESEIRVGEPHEAYIYVDPEVGTAIKSSIMQQIGIRLAQDPGKLALNFDHESYHFTHKALPFPRIEISQNLPRQTSSNVSPATLWLSGHWYAITLDGTPDESFERASRSSVNELKDTLEKLKDN